MYELGTNNIGKLKKIFSSSVTIQCVLGFLIVLVAETIGVWFLNTKMNIPDERIVAANWVLQFSIITFVINLVSIPYNAIIIAHEKMSVFTYIGILEAGGKLAIAFLIIISPIDKLVFYAILMCVVAFIVRLVYGGYCRRYFEECTYHFVFDKYLLKEMFNFAGWNFIGASSAILRDQGGNIIINLFCGPAVNAARGIAFQVSGAVQQFVVNFMTALNPQITKSYARGENQYMMTLIFKGARFSYYMLLILSLPILVNTHYILAIWLNIVPDYTVSFVQLVLIFAMSESISTPLITTMLATGNIKNYQIIVGGLQLVNLPLSYILLKMGCMPQTVLIVAICISQCCLVARLYLLRGMIGLSFIAYLKSVYLNVVMVTIIAFIFPVLFVYWLPESFLFFLCSSALTIICTLITIFCVGCNSRERQYIIEKFEQICMKLKKNDTDK